MFIICLDYILQTTVEVIKENTLIFKKIRSKWYPAETIKDTDCADDLALLTSTLALAKALMHRLG